MTEPKVVRYDLYGDWDGKAVETESSDGKWVRYSDYEALAARVEALLDARQADCENIQRHMAENKRLLFRVAELEAALDQYRGDADEWKCPTCGEWQREWQMYCDKPGCSAALKEQP